MPGQAFGRFGYSDRWTLPGFDVDSTGFAATHPLADRIRFPAVSQTWKPLATSGAEQTVALDGEKGGPSKMRASLTSVGFSMYFGDGLVLKVRSTAAPYLTWTEGSASENLPTPDEPWIVLSFRDAQPALVFGFEGAPTSLKVVGKPGNWTILGPKGYAGWVRIGLPAGLAASQANSAGALGQLAQLAAKEIPMWTRPAPRVVSMKAAPDADGVTATWTFDAEGALVPRAVTFAYLGGYALALASPVRRLAFTLGDGPIDVCTGRTLTVRLPVRRIPPGRGITMGKTQAESLATVSPIDVPSVVELALEMLPCNRDPATRRQAEETVSEYLTTAAYSREPHTGQLMPCDAAGNGLDLAAAHAMLMQTTISTAQSSGQANSLLTTVTWRRDWWTWLPWTTDDRLARRTAALTALAGALSEEPERRLAAGMFQAGLSAERGLAVWKSRHVTGVSAGSLLEVLPDLRSEIFSLIPPRIRLPGRSPEARFADTLFTPLRLFGDISVWADVPNTPSLRWWSDEAKPSVFDLLAPAGVDLLPASNLWKFETDRTNDLIDVAFTPAAAGQCEARLQFGVARFALPPTAPTPRYSEVSK